MEIVWDEHNLHHLLVDNAQRGISVEDVEAVLNDSETVAMPRPSGAELHIGRAPSSRAMAVVTIGDQEIYPKTAWWTSERSWRRSHGQQS